MLFNWPVPSLEILSETDAQTGPCHAVIFRSIRENISRIHKQPGMTHKPKFKARARLAKSLLHLVKLVARAAESIWRQARLADRQPRNQVASRAVNEMAVGVFAVSLAADAEVAAEEKIDARAGTKPGVMPKPVARKMINRILADGTAGERVQRQFLRAIHRC